MEAIFEINFPGDKKVDGHFRGFTVYSDQPVADGGRNSAPSPFDLFLVSIGMCAGFYVLSFCQSRSIPTDNIKLSQTVIRNDTTHRVEKLSIDVILPPDFPQKYMAAVINTAKTCSVKKFLEEPPQIEITTNMPRKEAL